MTGSTPPSANTNLSSDWPELSTTTSSTTTGVPPPPLVWELQSESEQHIQRLEAKLKSIKQSTTSKKQTKTNLPYGIQDVQDPTTTTFDDSDPFSEQQDEIQSGQEETDEGLWLLWNSARDPEGNNDDEGDHRKYLHGGGYDSDNSCDQGVSHIGIRDISAVEATADPSSTSATTAKITSRSLEGEASTSTTTTAINSLKTKSYGTVLQQYIDEQQQQQQREHEDQENRLWKAKARAKSISEYYQEPSVWRSCFGCCGLF